jgi:hypothetical protein
MTPEEEEKKPTFHRVGKLPKGLPDWFVRLDTDHDGQVGLYEWKEAGRSLDEFRKLDRNGDGFITVEEALHSVKIVAANSGGPGTPSRAGDDSAEESSSGRPVASAGPRAQNNNDGNNARPSRRQGGNGRWGNGGGRRGGNRSPDGGNNGGGNQQGGGQGGGNQPDDNDNR